MNEYGEKCSGFFVGAKEYAEYLMAMGEATEKARAKGEVAEINGEKMYWTGDEWHLLPDGTKDDPPYPSELRFFALDGLIAYINENPEGVLQEGRRYIVQVIDERTVALFDHPSEREKVRHVIAGCYAHTPKIAFERYLDTEQFNTMLLSTFIDTEARKLLFTVVKSMTKEQNLNTTDDGVSQVITVKQGISTASNVQFQNPVPLKPMRTFIEIEQPESNFTLRVNEKAECALFESDGGAWKNIAVQRIASYIRSMIFVSNVIVLA